MGKRQPDAECCECWVRFSCVRTSSQKATSKATTTTQPGSRRSRTTGNRQQAAGSPPASACLIDGTLGTWGDLKTELAPVDAGAGLKRDTARAAADQVLAVALDAVGGVGAGAYQ